MQSLQPITSFDDILISLTKVYDFQVVKDPHNDPRVDGSPHRGSYSNDPRVHLILN